MLINRWFLLSQNSENTDRILSFQSSQFSAEYLAQSRSLLNICCCSFAKSCLTLCNSMDAVHQTSLSFTISRSLFKLMSIESVIPSNHLSSQCYLGLTLHSSRYQTRSGALGWYGRRPILPSHPLWPPFPLALSLCQHQGFFPVSWLFASGDQSIGASALVLPKNIQG